MKMLEIYPRFIMKPENLVKAGAAKRLKRLQSKPPKREMDRMFDEQRDESALINREASVSKWAVFKRKAKNSFKDLRCYIDFRMAQLIVWRELRREKRKAKSSDVEE